MKTLWLKDRQNYDGSQLSSLFAYRTEGVLGPSCIAFRGACNVSFEKMIDLEDLRARSRICGEDMLHVIVEMFDRDLFAAVCMQRILADLTRSLIAEMTGGKIQLRREGDDLYQDQKKLSISIATVSPVSQLLHFAVNVSNAGTPVPTCALGDFGIDAEKLGRSLIGKFAEEYASMLEATQKARPVV